MLMYNSCCHLLPLEYITSAFSCLCMGSMHIKSTSSSRLKLPHAIACVTLDRRVARKLEFRRGKKAEQDQYKAVGGRGHIHLHHRPVSVSQSVFQAHRSNMSWSARLMFLLLLFLSASRALCARKDGVYGDGVSSPTGCQNCSICQYPCRPQPPPPPEGYPSSGTPPPPTAQGNCPPATAGCCQYPQYNPPSPPNPYTYVPYNNFSASPPMLLSPESPASILFTFLFLPAFVSSLYMV